METPPDDFGPQSNRPGSEQEELDELLEQEAELLRMMAEEQAAIWAEKIKENGALLGGIAAGSALVGWWIFGGSSSDEKVPTRTLDDDYVRLLAQATRRRMRNQEGVNLGEALADTLRLQAPVRYENPSRSGGGSFWRKALGLGLAAGAVWGADQAARSFTGRSLVDWVQNPKPEHDTDLMRTGPEAPTAEDPFAPPAQAPPSPGAPPASSPATPSSGTGPEAPPAEETTEPSATEPPPEMPPPKNPKSDQPGSDVSDPRPESK